MADRDPQRDIARYLSLQGRAPQSHFDWDTWRKIGQPGTYQAPPGSPSTFQGITSGAGRPNYGPIESNYNMYDGSVGQAIGNLAARGIQKLVGRRGGDGGKMDGDGSGSTASAGSSSTMPDDMDGAPMRGSNRSQNASITAPATSRGMRRSRGGDFSGALASTGVSMVQGNDNYGTVYGNMGGANVGSGNYDNSFQSKNSGGTQTAFSNNGGGGGTPPPPFPPPTTGTTPPPPPPPPPGGGGTPTPTGGGTPTPPGGGTPPVYTSPPRVPYTIPTGTTTPGGPPALPQGPAGPQAIPSGQGPSTYGNTGGVQGAQETKDLERLDKVTSLTTQGSTEGERDAAGTILNNNGIQSNVNPANQRGANDTAPPMLAGYENMQETAPQQNTRFGDMGMGIPAGAPTGGGLPAQYDRMRPALPAQYQTPSRTYDRPSTTMGNLNPSPFYGNQGAPGQGNANPGLPPQYASLQGAVRANPAAYANKVGPAQQPAPSAQQPAPAKKAGGRKAAAPKATPGPKSVAAKKTPAKKQAGTKAEPKKKGTK